MPDDSSNKDHSKNDLLKDAEKKTHELASRNIRLRTVLSQIRERLLPSIHRPGVHTANYLRAAGFKYIGEGDTARCDDCGLEVSNWSLDMNPFSIHSTKRPNCPFVCSIKASSSLPTTAVRNTSIPNEQQNSSEHQRIQKLDLQSLSNTFIESYSLQQVRRRTFSHWPHRTIPSSTQMIEAGFFNCNVRDRVICIYCNLICQQWTPYVDDPCEVHRTLSPNCIYAESVLKHRGPIHIINGDGSSMRATTSSPSFASNHINSLRMSQSVRPVAQNNNRDAFLNDLSSPSTSSNDKLPSADDRIQGNYFNTDAKTIATCFYCNGSLQNWDPDNNPMIEHARWFPHCPYVKQLCGIEMYREIQEVNRAQQERAKANTSRGKADSGAMSNINLSANSGHLLVPDESTLSRLVAARLELPMSQSLLNRNFKLHIIERCWKDQLRLKRENFVSDYDLYVAYLILQKQIEHIDGKKENIVIPSERMRQFTEHAIKEQAEILAQMRAVAESTLRSATRSGSRNASNGSDVEMLTSSESPVNSTSKSTTTENHDGAQTIKETACTTCVQDQSLSSAPTDICVVCCSEKKELAFLPCGHLATCVPCGYSLKSCPICRREKTAVVKVYI